MTSIHQRYAELLNLTQLYLLREYSLQHAKMVDPVVWKAIQKKTKVPAAMPIHTNTPSFEKAALPLQKNEIPLRAVIPPLSSVKDVTETEKPPAAATASEIAKSSPSRKSPPASFLQPIEPVREAMATASPHEFKEFWKTCQTLFPEWKLSEKIPCDAIAKKNKQAWLKNQEISPVILLSFHENEQQFSFLKNIAQAISLRLAPTRVMQADKLEKENGWEQVLNSPHLRLIIASDYGLYLQPKLMQFYREEPDQNKHFLNQIPLLLLSDLSLYLKEPQLKSLLWRAICNECTSLNL